MGNKLRTHSFVADSTMACVDQTIVGEDRDIGTTEKTSTVIQRKDGTHLTYTDLYSGGAAYPLPEESPVIHRGMRNHAVILQHSKDAKEDVGSQRLEKQSVDLMRKHDPDFAYKKIPFK